MHNTACMHKSDLQRLLVAPQSCNGRVAFHFAYLVWLCRPSLAWPSEGSITVDKLIVRYRPDLPAVLKDLTFHIKSHEKVGICGRTGCGKSTLMLALYRIVEPSSGSIKIDGVEVTGIGLYDLRSRLSLVPQDPVIFTGSLRSNLAPFGDQTDGAMWQALRQAGLESTVRGFEVRSHQHSGFFVKSQSVRCGALQQRASCKVALACWHDAYAQAIIYNLDPRTSANHQR